MPTFDTPEPISVTMHLVVGDARIVASDRGDTVVEVRPSDASRESDVKAAAQTRVEYAHGRLLVRAPKPRGLSGYIGRGGSIDVAIDVPAGSGLQGDAAWAGLRCEGRLGACRFQSAAGDLWLERTGPLHMATAAGDVTVDHAVGHARVATASGDVRIRTIDGTAVVETASGDTWVGEVTGDLRVHAASGAVAVDRAHAAVEAKTASGSVRIGEVMRGSVVLQTASGDLEVGIRTGTAAWLDLRSQSGSVHRSLDTADGPEPSDDTVEVRAGTSSGDIVVRRS